MITKDDIMDAMVRLEGGRGGETSWASYVDGLRLPETAGAPGIVEYIESASGAGEGTKLYPIQRFILKMIQLEPLDDDVEDIEVWDKFRENLVGQYSEVGFLRYLNQCDPPRCNVTPEEYEERVEGRRKFTDVVFRLGRRGTKSSLSQWIAKYRTYLLTRLGNPQQHYKKLADTSIGILLVSVSKDKAQKLLAPTLYAVKASPTLSQYLVNPRTTTKLELMVGDSPDPRHRRSRVEITTAPCSAKSMRGEANLVILLEEFGHFFFELNGSDKSDKQVYEAVDPSRADFIDPDTGLPDGLMLIISTPTSKMTYMFKVEQDIWDGQKANGLVLHVPSYWVNPQLSPTILRDAYNRDPQTYDQEYGGDYVEGVSTALSKGIIEDCWSDEQQFYGVVRRGEIAAMGVDLGLTGDGTGIFVVAINPQTLRMRLVWREYHHVLQPEYVGLTKLDIEVMAERIDDLWDRFGCLGGYADMWEFSGLTALLASQARTKLEQISTTPQENNRVARLFLETLNQGILTIYRDDLEWDFTDESRFDFSRELLNLQRIQRSGDPPLIKIAAPPGDLYHDDQYSACSRAISMAVKLAREQPGSTSVPTGRQRAQQGQVQQRMAARRAARLNQNDLNRRFRNR